MGGTTGIEWTDVTWNPIRGCSRVSEGCRHCYAETVANRFCGPGKPYEGLVRLGADGKGTGQWNGEIKFVERHLLDPLLIRKPRRIFVNSMSDLFHEKVTDEMLDRIFAVMALCPQHTFQVLTKRPERMLAYLRAPDRERRVARACIDPDNDYPVADGYFSCDESGNHNLYEVFWKNCRLYFKNEDGVVQEAHRDERWMQFVAADFCWPLPNVWLGVSVEDQKTADERIPLLLQTPAAVRFISAEPLLGPVTLGGYGFEGVDAEIDWVICGGESGPGARPMHPGWARGLRDQCVAADVPFFFKQWGEWGYTSDARVMSALVYDDGTAIEHKLEAVLLEEKASGRHHNKRCPVIMSRGGKKAAGRLLDGMECNQMPEVVR